MRPTRLESYSWIRYFNCCVFAISMGKSRRTIPTIARCYACMYSARVEESFASHSRTILAFAFTFRMMREDVLRSFEAIFHNRTSIFFPRLAYTWRRKNRKPNVQRFLLSIPLDTNRRRKKKGEKLPNVRIVLIVWHIVVSARNDTPGKVNSAVRRWSLNRIQLKNLLSHPFPLLCADPPREEKIHTSSLHTNHTLASSRITRSWKSDKNSGN